MSCESTIILFNVPADALESVGVALPPSLVADRHVDPARTFETLQSRQAAAFVLWSGPGAEAEQAATDLVDVLARCGSTRPVLFIIDGWVAEPGTAIAEVAGLPWTRRLDCAWTKPERALALGTFLEEAVRGAGGLLGLERTLFRLWGASLSCYRHDRGNAVRRLLQLGSADTAGLKRYVAEHGPTLLARIGTLDSAFLEAVRWYLPWNEADRSSMRNEFAERTKLFSRLVQAPDAATFRSFLEGEERLRTLLVAEWPRLGPEEST